jgi:hypothetical protein
MANNQFRPYSKSELLDLERDIYSRHRIGNVAVTHVPCLHEYRVKRGGRKEQHLQQRSSETKHVMDEQTCSVCFKLRTCDEEPPTIPSDIEPLSREKLEKIDTFYKWLYRHDF